MSRFRIREPNKSMTNIDRLAQAPATPQHTSPLATDAAQALLAQALAALQGQNFVVAHSAVQALLALRPTDPMALQLQGLVALGQGQLPLAVSALQQALAQHDAALQLAGAVEDADFASTLCTNLGQVLCRLQQLGSALALFDRAVRLQPSNGLAHVGRAEVLSAWGQFGEAGRAATQAVQHEPNNVQALSLLGNSLYQCAAYSEALKVFAALLRVHPTQPFVAGMCVLAARNVCNWQRVGLPLTQAEFAAVSAELPAPALATGAFDVALLAHRARHDEPVLEPFSALLLLDDLRLQRQITQQWMARLHPPQLPPSQLEPQEQVQGQDDGPLRLAYVSSDWREHATTFLLAGVLAHHDRAQVEVFLVSYGPPVDDAMTQRLKAMGHTWVDAQVWSDAQVAQWCRAQGVQVAVDLKGLTTHSRPGIFAHRAAPVQVSWLGYPATMAAPYYDYLLADRVVVPPELAEHYSERLAYLPHSYQPNDRARRVDSAAQTRSAHGLPRKGAVLCCFNNVFKITPEVWAMWMRFLRAAPDAVLWLLQSHEQALANLRDQAQAAGVAPERLVFAPHVPQAQHLARLQLADLSLETWPYNAHTTASDALWAGVPHLTVPGQSFASRVGASVLTAMGMPTCILADQAAYEARVVSLLRQPKSLGRLKRQVQSLRGTCALFDSARFAADLEGVLLDLWQTHVRVSAVKVPFKAVSDFVP